MIVAIRMHELKLTRKHAQVGLEQASEELRLYVVRRVLETRKEWEASWEPSKIGTLRTAAGQKPTTVDTHCEAILRKEYWIDHRLINIHWKQLGRHDHIRGKAGNMDPNNGKRTGR